MQPVYPDYTPKWGFFSPQNENTPIWGYFILFFYPIFVASKKNGSKNNSKFKIMKTDKMDKKQELPECNAIFAPVEEIKHIEQVIDNLELVHRELLKVAEGMKAIVE